MSYLGRTELKSSDIRLKAAYAISGSSTNTVVLTWTAPSEESLIFTVNGVVQQTDAFSIAGTPTTITLASGNFADGATVEVVGINDIGTAIVPADGSVTSLKLADDAVTLAKMADDSVGVAELATTGTPTGAKFLQDDMAWTTVDSLPSQTGESGKFLTTSGSAASWAAVAGTSVTATKATGTTTLVAADASGYVVVPCDSSGGNVIIKLPAAAAAWSGSVLHIVASTAPGTGYNVVIQNSAATELAQLNKKGDYYTVTCDSGGSNLVVIDHNQSYGGWLITTNQQASMAHSLGAGQLFTDPTKYSVGYNYGSWWDSLTDKLTVPTGWAGRIYLNLNSGNRSAGYVATGIDKDGSQLKTPVIYLAAGAPQPFEWDEAVTGGEEYVPYGFNTYTSSTRYIEDGCVFTWTAVRDI